MFPSELCWQAVIDEKIKNMEIHTGTFLWAGQKWFPSFLLTFHWLQLSHMAAPSPTREPEKYGLVAVCPKEEERGLVIS